MMGSWSRLDGPRSSAIWSGCHISDCHQTVLSFEKPQDLYQRDKIIELDRTLRTVRIRWIWRRYHKWPPVLSTFCDTLVGILAGLSVCLTQRIHIIHARGYVTSLIALVLKRVSGAKFLFDMRGFWADEKVDGGHWSRDSWIYGVTKRCERSFYEIADAIVSLTQEGAKAIPALGYRIPAGTPIRVIPTCADLEKFMPGPKDQMLLNRLGLTGHCVIGCIGTMSNRYLRRSMLEYLGFFTKHLDNTKILVVTHEGHDRLRSDAVNAGVPTDRLVLTAGRLFRHADLHEADGSRNVLYQGVLFEARIGCDEAG